MADNWIQQVLATSPELVKSLAEKEGVTVEEYVARITQASSAPGPSTPATTPLASSEPATKPLAPSEPATTPAPVVPVSNDSEGDILGMFISLLEKLLRNLSTTFANCTAIPVYQNKLKLAKVLNQEDEVIRKWHHELSPFYSAIDACDEAKLIELDRSSTDFQQLRILEKWNDPGFTDDHKEILWKYLKKLCTYSRLHCQIPNKMMEKIVNMAHKLKQGSANGLDVSKLDLRSIGEEVVQGLDISDQQSFASNLPGIFDAIRKMGGIDPSMLTKVISSGGQGSVGDILK